ncbi:MAG: hypothetical protein ACAI25_13980 [Planctomycetota bacterium]
MTVTPRPPRTVAVLREPIFSPGMVDHDAAILRASAGALASRHGVSCPVLSVAELGLLDTPPEVVLSMAEGDDSLRALARFERDGAAVVNSTSSVRATRRQELLALSRPVGPLVEGALVATCDPPMLPAGVAASGSVWVKRADYHALGPGDVVQVPVAELGSTLAAMARRGIASAIVQPHLEGPVVKFYAVSGARPFFRAFALDGSAPLSPIDRERLEAHAFEAARSAGLTVFGGDAVLLAGDEPVLIDLNAWPSFWRCLADAAIAIADHAASVLAARAPSRVG